MSDMADREANAYTLQTRVTMVELRTRPADRKSWLRSSSTYSRTFAAAERTRAPNAFEKRAHQQNRDSPKPWLNCEPTQPSKELVTGNPRPTAAELTSSRSGPQLEPKSRMCGPQVRFCERGPG